MEDVIATYYFRPQGSHAPEEIAQAIADEETTGTWTDVTTRTAYVRQLDGVVESLEVSGKGYIAKIRYPNEIFEPGNIPQYLSVIAGNLFGLSSLEAVRLLDCEFPENLTPAQGPKFGIEGIRHLLGTRVRPHIGTIIKPKVGLSPEDTAAVAYQAAIGGVDLIKDDETLTDQEFCPVRERLPRVMERLEEAKSETGHEVLYAVNITTRADMIVELAEEMTELGANMLMLDVLTAGFSALQALAGEPNIHVPIHVHRTMHAAMTRNPEHGIAMRPIARLVRMLGGDQLHTGAVSGKMHHITEEVQDICTLLRSPLYGLKPTFPVSSGGLHPGKVSAELSALGRDVVLQAGGGIHGHPDGTTAGVLAMRQAVDAYMAGIPAEEYARDHYELERALKKWGTR